jgi:hypothetical protein
VAVGFDPAKLDEAAETSRSLGELRAEASVDKTADRAKKLIRDQAYTHLKEAVDTIRECGQFVFWKNEDRAKGYASEYMRRHRRRSQSSSQDTASENTLEPSAD